MARKIIPIAIGAALVVVATGYAAIALFSPGEQRGAPEPVQETRAASGKQAAPGAAEESQTASLEQPARSGRSAPRQIAPDVFSAPPVEADQLERIEARDPLTKPEEKASPDPATWQMELLHKPAIPASGRVLIGGHDIVLAGITTLEPGQTCSDGTAAEGWHCGNMARTEFRAWVRGRALECRVPKEPVQGEITTSCTLGGQDLAEWLVQAGWARPIEARRFQEASEFAQANNLGMFQPSPQPEEDAQGEKPAGLY